jgi:thiosulfate/3-mercaptopyruvate sulfurtransferase
MSYSTILSITELLAHLDDPAWVVVDCRFSLADTERGWRDYQRAHIPGAVYAHLDRDLSGPIVPGHTGRHPLPDAERFAETLSAWGIDNQTQVVVYDDAGGVNAGRLWWMLRWLGHDAVALLDGDWRAWQRSGLPVVSGVESRTPRRFTAAVRPLLQVHADEVLHNLHHPEVKLIDARSTDRFRGENETIDPKAGHIPGAFSAFYGPNLTEDGYFLPAEQLRARFLDLLQETPPDRCVLYCGSGVSAIHNLIAMEIAGLPGARLYVGSWSEWITDPERPIATGEVT